MSSSGKSQINLANKYDRVIILIDMDCFYCQVEEKLNPELKGKPVAVVQYNTWQGGGIIAVNYAARAQGVTRHMRGNQAKEQCPEIELVSVPSIRDKGDLSKYREAGKQVANVLQKFTPLLERASVDEAYLDVTEEVNKRAVEIDKGQFNIKPEQLVNTFALGYHNLSYFINDMSCKFDNTENLSQDYDLEQIEHNENEIESVRTSNFRLLVGASIANEIRAAVKETTGYECSAGIAHNKILAKLACGINKPNKQTLLPLKNIIHTFRTLEVRKITGLGGKFGEDVCEKLGIRYIGEIIKFTEKELQKKFDEKSGTWLYLISRGIDLEAITPRFYSKRIGCSKNFPGRNAITGLNTLLHWLKELSEELCVRLQKDEIENNRKGKQIIIGFSQEINSEDVSSSRSANISNYDSDEMAKIALDILKRNTQTFLKAGNDTFINNSIKHLSLSVAKFETIQSQGNTLKSMFEKQKSKQESREINCDLSESQPKAIIENGTNDQKRSNKKVSLQEMFQKQKENQSKITSITPALSTLVVESQSCESNKKDCNSVIDKGDSDISSDTEQFMALEILKKLEHESNEMNVDCEKESLGLVDDGNINDFNEKQVPSISPVLEAKNSSDALEGTSRNNFHNYAEFQVLESRAEDFILCSQCNQKVHEHQMQTHMDGHLAFELSQQQRLEYRNEIKKQFVLTSPPNKKQKLNNSLNKNFDKSKKSANTRLEKTKNSNISKFLKILEPNENEIKCIECNFYISRDKILEHKDLHLAQKLQRDWSIESCLKTTGKEEKCVKSIFSPVEQTSTN